MNYMWYFHWIFPIIIVLLPLLPNKILKKIFWLPLLLTVIWIIFDGCPLNYFTPLDETNIDKNEFFLPIFKKYIYKDITKHQCDNIANLIIGLSITISAYKLLSSCNKKNQIK